MDYDAQAARRSVQSGNNPATTLAESKALWRSAWRYFEQSPLAYD
jgi:hypothetical protein